MNKPTKPTHDAWGVEIWYPEDKPYRVVPIFRSNDRLHYGWKSGKVDVFATLDEAKAHAATLKKIKGIKSVTIHKAQNASTWAKNGKWVKVKD